MSQQRHSESSSPNNTPVDNFIVIDGPDGAGKSTQVSLLAEHLRSSGREVLTVRDPGGTDIGEAIRRILLSPAHDRMDPRSELLLYTAARLQLWIEKIAPALRAGSSVISDRWVYSTCAYQGAAGNLGLQTVYDLTDAMNLPWPGKAVILDLDPAVGLARISTSPDRIEAKSLTFHRAVRDGYLSVARLRPEVTVIDGAGQPQQIQLAIRRALAIE